MTHYRGPRRCALALLAASALTPAAPLAARTINDNIPQVYVMTPTGVNLQTGAFMNSATDFVIGPLKFTRSWGSEPSFGIVTSNTDDQNFGYWNHNYGYGVQVTSAANGDTVADVYVEGTKRRFKWGGNTAGWYPYIISGDNLGGDLTVSTVDGKNVFTYVSRGGDTYHFTTHPATNKANTYTNVGNDGTQPLAYVDFADGSRLDFTYDAAGRPHMVASNHGYAIVLDYNASSGNIETACGYNTASTLVTATSTCAGATIKATYGYTTIGVAKPLSSATDAAGSTTTFQYTVYGNQRPNLTCVTIPGTSTCEYQNIYQNLPGETPTYAPYQVRRQIDANGKNWDFSYVPPDPEQHVDYDHPLLTQSIMNDPQGGQIYTDYTNGLLTRLVDHQVETRTQYSGVVPTSFQHPEGNKTDLAYDARNNLIFRSEKPKPGSTEANAGTALNWSADYPANYPNSYYTVGCQDGAGVRMAQKLCDKPRSITDPKGNVTTFTYDPASGLKLTETSPAVNGVTAQTRYNYEQRYAWLRNSGGTWTQAATPVWLLTAKSICRDGNPAVGGVGCAIASDEVITTYDYGPAGGPNNLLLRGMVEDAGTGRLNLRTCYGYDQQGNRISTQTPRAGVTTCN